VDGKIISCEPKESVHSKFNESAHYINKPNGVGACEFGLPSPAIPYKSFESEIIRRHI